MKFSLQMGSKAKKSTQNGSAGDFQENPLLHGFFCLYFGKPQIDKPQSFDGIFVASGFEDQKKCMACNSQQTLGEMACFSFYFDNSLH